VRKLNYYVVTLLRSLCRTETWLYLTNSIERTLYYVHERACLRNENDHENRDSPSNGLDPVRLINQYFNHSLMLARPEKLSFYLFIW